MDGVEPSLLALAASQHGLFTTAQTERLGVSRVTLGRYLRAGLIERRLRGVYAVPRDAHSPALATAAAPSPEDEHLELCRAAWLVYPDAVLTSTSAVVAAGLPVWGADLSRPFIRRIVDRGRGIRGVHVRRPAGTTVETEHGPTVPLVQALSEHAVDHGIVQGVVCADAALQRGLVAVDELRDHVATLSTRWSSRPKAMTRLMDGRSESVGESRLRCILAFDGFTMVPQVEVCDADGRVLARLDGVLEGTRIALEFDGKIKYASGDTDVLYAEKKREDMLRARGWIIVRISWADLEHPARIFAKVRRALRVADQDCA